jgi:hypothetical protein
VGSSAPSPEELAKAIDSLREVDQRYLRESDRGVVRYFRGQGVELHVWVDAEGGIDHLQFLLGKRALIWSRRQGFVLGEAEQEPRGPGSTGMMPAAELIQPTGELNGLRDALQAVVARGPIDEAVKLLLRQILASLPAP